LAGSVSPVEIRLRQIWRSRIISFTTVRIRVDIESPPDPLKYHGVVQ
jgi:hypothetical protein